MNEDVKRIKELTALLNHHRDAYYNDSKPEISDYEYDTLYDELKSLENKSGICLGFWFYILRFISGITSAYSTKKGIEWKISIS